MTKEEVIQQLEREGLIASELIVRNLERLFEGDLKVEKLLSLTDIMQKSRDDCRFRRNRILDTTDKEEMKQHIQDLCHLKPYEPDTIKLLLYADKLFSDGVSIRQQLNESKTKSEQIIKIIKKMKNIAYRIKGRKNKYGYHLGIPKETDIIERRTDVVDKKGRYIYEGDEIEYCGVRSTVQWNEDFDDFDFFTKIGGEWACLPLLDTMGEDIEVISNNKKKISKYSVVKVLMMLYFTLAGIALIEQLTILVHSDASWSLIFFLSTPLWIAIAGLILLKREK